MAFSGQLGRLVVATLLALTPGMMGAKAEIALAQGSAAGTRVPIVPCRADADLGCAEVLIEATTPAELEGLVNCQTLPIFGEAGVELTQSLTAVAPATHRLSLQMQPLSAIRAGSYPISLGRPDPVTGKLVCAITLQLDRAAATLAAPTAIILPTRQIGTFWNKAPTVVKLGPAPGSIAVGPLAAPATVQLRRSDASAGQTDLRVTLQEAGRIQPGQTIDLSLAPEGAMTLGRQTGTLVVTGPQLVAPVTIAVEMTTQIGLPTILLALGAGILIGWLVRKRLIPARDLAEARVLAERTAIWAGRRLATETDADLLKQAAGLIGTMRQAVAPATTRTEIETAASTLQTGLDALLANKAAERRALQARIAPQLAAYALPLGATELPDAPLAAHREALLRAEALLAARRGDLARPLIDTTLPGLEDAALQALRQLAARARGALAGLALWTDATPRAALAPMVALAPGFAVADAARLADVLPALRGAWFGLSAAAAGALNPFEPYLRNLLAGSAGNGTLAAQAGPLTDAALTVFETRPLAAAATLADLHALYLAAAGGQPFDTAFVPMVEAAGATREAEAATLPQLPVLSLVVVGGSVMAGQPFEVSVGGLSPGEEAQILTPVNCLRLGPEDASGPARLIPEAAVPMAVTVRVRQPGSAAYRQVQLDLTVDPSPADARLAKLIADRNCLNRQATGWAVGLALVSGVWVFQAVPLTSWSALMAPVLWGFFANLSLPDAIERLQGQRKVLFDAMKIA